MQLCYGCLNSYLGNNDNLNTVTIQGLVYAMQIVMGEEEGACRISCARGGVNTFVTVVTV